MRNVVPLLPLSHKKLRSFLPAFDTCCFGLVFERDLAHIPAGRDRFPYSPAPMKLANNTGNLRGLAAMFIAVAAFSFMDALLKLFAAHYPPMQVTVLRAAASLPFVLLPLIWQGRLTELRIHRYGLHLLRGVLGVLMLVTFIYALGTASLASVYSIYMTAPLLIAAMAALWLGEKVDRGRWLAIFIGLAGVWIILQPRPGGLPLLAGIAATVSALSYAVAVITARVLTRSETSSSMVFTFCCSLRSSRVCSHYRNGSTSDRRTGGSLPRRADSAPSASTTSPKRFDMRLRRSSRPSNTPRCSGASGSTGCSGTCFRRRGC